MKGKGAQVQSMKVVEGRLGVQGSQNTHKWRINVGVLYQYLNKTKQHMSSIVLVMIIIILKKEF